MKLKQFIFALVAMLSSFAFTANAQVAKVGNTEYATIDEAISNWTNGTTLTLLADVTLSDVIKLSSTEYHILDLGTYTMTAASSSKKYPIVGTITTYSDAIEIVNNGRSSASYALDIVADANNPGGITATSRSVVKTTGKSGVQDRPIIRFYGGVFNGSNVVSHSGSNGTNCPQFWFYGGEFNGTISANRAKFLFYGGTFNGTLSISVDSSADALVCGGKFKKLSNSYGSSLNTDKFTIGSAAGVYDRGIYVDAEGYYVITSAPITEVSAKYPAVKKESYNSNNYFYYSAAATYGMFYEVASMAGTGSNVTVWEPVKAPAVEDIVKPEATEEEKAVVEEVIAEVTNNAAVKNNTVELPAEVVDFAIELAAVEVAEETTPEAPEAPVTVVTEISYTVTPSNAAGEKVSKPSEPITFRLPLPSNWASEKVKVIYNGTALDGDYTVMTENGAKYVEVESQSFSTYTVQAIVPVAKIGETPYATLAEAVAAAGANETITLLADVTLAEMVTIPAGKTITLDLNGHTITGGWNGNSTTNHIYALSNNGTLTIQDSKGNGSINSRGIHNYGSLTLNAGAINAIDGNGGYAVNNQNGSTFVMNGGVVAATYEDDHQSSSGGYDATALKVPAGCTATLNGGTINNVCDFTFAIDAAGTLNIPATSTITVNGTHGAIAVSGGETTINAGTFQIPADEYTRTDNVLYVSGGSLVVNGGTFIGDSDTASGGSCLYDAAGKAVVNGGTFKGSSGGDVWGTTGTTIKGGTFENLTEKQHIAAGYELNADGTVTAKPVAEVNGTKYTSLAEAVAAAQSGDEIVMLADVTLAEALTLPAGITFNGNDKQITGTLVAAGDITFAGVTKAGDLDFAVGNTVVNIPAGASLQLNGSARMSIGFGTTFNIVGTIEDAKTADKATVVPSLVIPGASFSGAGVTFNVTNAYISAPSSYCSSSKTASGTFDFNITNSIWESAGKLAFEEQSVNAKVDFALVNSVLTTGSHLVFGTASGEEGVVIDNSYVNKDTSRQLENCGTMTIKNGSVVNGAVATSSNAKNPGTVIVENATYAVTGEFSGSDLGTGTIIIKKGATVSAGSITKANIIIDAAEMTEGELANFTANLAKFAGTLSVINNDKLEAKIVDGKVVLAAKPAAKIGEQGYATIKDAVAAVQEGETITILAGTIEEGAIKLPATLKNVTIKGEEGAILKDMTISAADGNSVNYDGLTFDGITFDNSNVVLTGWRTNAVVYKNITVNGCTFKNIVRTNNEAAFHINCDAKEAVNGFTFTNNIIDGVSGASNSGIYAQLTGNVVVSGNVINNVAFRPYVIQVTTDDGVADNFTVTGNTFSGSSVGRAQGLGNNAEGTDNVNLVVSNNIFKGITDSQQICYWNFNAEKTTADLSKNYYDIDILANPSRIYYNSAAENTADLTNMGIFPIYTELNEDGTINIESAYYPPVAKIGETTYASLAEAVAAAQAGEVIVLIADVKTTDGVVITDKNLTIDLNGKTYTVTEGASTNNRNFKINGTSVVTVKNGTMVAAGEYSSGAYGTIRTEGTANVTLTGLKLYNYRGNGLNIKACTGTTVTVDNTEIYANYGGGIEAAGGTIVVNDGVTVEQKGMYTAPYNSMAISVNGGGKVTVNGGTFSTECITAEEANNQGTSHGPWVAGVLNSGGTLIINGGTFSNDNFGENSLATAARGAILADTKAKVEINGGTFNVLKNVIDIQNNLGDANNNPSVVLAGGTYNADPRISAQYGSNLITLAEDYIAVENNGVWTIELAAAKIGETTYATLEEAFKAATSGCTIDIVSDVTVSEYWDSRYTGSKFTVPVTINGNGHTIKFTNTVYDGANYMSAFRFEADATVNNLTIDMSEALSGFAGRFRAISAKGNLTVDGCTFIGNGSENNTRAIIFGEGASTAENTIAITNSTFNGWRRGISDSESGKDVAANVTVTGNTLDNAAVYVSATENVTFKNNTVNANVDIRSYTADNTLNVTATDNTLAATEGVEYKIKAGGTITAQNEFVVPAKGSNSPAYTGKDENGNVRVWGEGGGNAKESFELKLYAGETLVATSKLNNIGGIIDGDVYVTWNFFYPSSNDEYWTTTWEVGHPNSAAQPTTLDLVIDGTVVATTDVQMNAADNLFPVKWAELGGVKYICTGLAGEGTEANPYLINRIEDLAWFRDDVNAGNNYSGKFVKLAADIDLNNEEWEPIGYMGKSFVGNFDGGNFTISNLKVAKALTNASANNGVGLFGRVDSPATIKDLTIENATVTGSLYVGALVGYAYTGKAIENVTVKGDIAINAYWYAGVIGGNGYMNLVNNCHVIGNDGSYIKGNNGSYIGGIWGFRGEGANNITNCTVTNLSIEGVDRVGGISGMAHYGNTISGCAVKDVTVAATDAEATTVGLIAGACQGTTTEPSVITGSTVENVKVTIDGAEVEASIFGTNINGETPVTNFVAKIGAAYYETLAEAIKACVAGDNTIELLADCAEKVAITQVNGTNIVINGNGKTYSGTITVKGDGVKNNLYNTETLTFQNINFAPAYNTYAITAEKNTYARNITVDGCTFKGNNDVYGIRVRNGYNYTVKNTTAEGVYTFFNASEALTGLTVENVTVTCANVAFSGAYGFGDASFKNVTVESDNNGVKVNNPNGSALTFEDCSITAKAPVTFTENAGVASALTAEFNGTNNMVVNNGGTYWFNIVEADATDATFKVIVNDANLDMSNTAFEASVGNVYYSNLTAAVNAAVDGETVVVARDIELNAANCVTNSDGYSVFVNVAGKAITIDLNGKAITANLSASQFASAKSSLLMAVFSVDTNGNLTLNDNVGTGKVAVTANDASVYSLISNYDKSAKLTINGGSYELDAARAKSSLIHSDPSEAVVVNGGNFYLGNVNTGENGSPWIFNVNGNNTGHVIVNGGTFNYDVNHQYWAFEVHVDKNKAVKANGNGTWTVFDAIAYVTEENNGYTREAGYATVEEAINSKYGNVVTILAGDYTGDLNVNKGITVKGEVDAEGNNLVTFNGKLNITADGATVKNINVNNGGNSAAYVGAKDVVVDGCQVVGGNGFRSCYTSGTVTFKNSVITGATYGIHFDGNAGGNIVIENCTITGWTSFASTIENVAISGTEFAEGNYNQLRFYQNAQLTDCTFNEKMTVDFGTNNTTAEFNNCTVENGKALTDVVYIADIAEMGIVVTVDGEPICVAAKVNDKYYLSLQAAIDAATEGQTVTIVSDIALTEGVTVAADDEIFIDLNGKTITGTPAEAKAFAVITNNGTLTIEGNGSVICNHTLAGSTSYAVNTITNSGSLTIDGATIENKSTANNQIGYAIDNNSTVADAVVTIVSGTVTVSGSNYYDGIRQFCNSTTAKNDVVVSGGKVSSIWMQNPSDGATQNTKDVNGSVTIEGGEVTALYLEPSAKFEAAITAGHVGNVSNFQTAAGRDLKEFVTGGTFGTVINEEFLAWGYQLTGNAAPYRVDYTARREALTIVDGEVTEFVNAQEITVGTLTYERTGFPVNTWVSLYVPFEIPVSKLTELGYDVAYPNDIHFKGAEDDGVVDEIWAEYIKINAGVLKANFPYMIRANNQEATTMELVLEETTLYSTDSEQTVIECSSAFYKFNFAGTYEAVNRTDIGYEEGVTSCFAVANSGNWAEFTKDTHTLNPFRVYMTMTAKAGAPYIIPDEVMKSIGARVVGEENEDGTTVIYDVNAENGEDVIYDLNGRRVLETEKGGLYIINGKKVLVK